MAVIKPFKSLRPKEDLVARISSLPYDIIGWEKAREIIDINPDSFLRVIKPEAALEQGVKKTNLQLAKIGAKSLQEFIERKVFIREDKDCFYLYCQSNNLYYRIGLVACLSVKDYLKGIIKRHENVNVKTYQGRVSHIKTSKTHTGCILVVYKSNKNIENLIAEATINKNIIYSFQSDDGIENVCWKIDQKEIIQFLIKSFQPIDSLYIADGHHRAAAAVEVSQLIELEKKKDKGGDTDNAKEHMYFPAVLIPHTQIRILAYHRLINVASDFDQKDFLAKLQKIVHLTQLVSDTPFLPTEKNEFGMNISGKWYYLKLREDILNKQCDNIIDRLDVSLLQNLVLKPLLGIRNPQKDDRLEFIGGEDALVSINEKAKQRTFIIFTLFPTSIDDVIEVSERKQVMPPKSTWFEPKVRSGIFLHPFNDE
ncbi:MAG TPA: DUF1015 family protein [Atribacterota bacterium]|nr:DUF1015 family protein [Atribacterota bacterium]